MTAVPDPDWAGVLDPPRVKRPSEMSNISPVVAAANAQAEVIKHGERLQCAVNDIRTFCRGKHTVGAIEITNIIESHHV